MAYSPKTSINQKNHHPIIKLQLKQNVPQCPNNKTLSHTTICHSYPQDNWPQHLYTDDLTFPLTNATCHTLTPLTPALHTRVPQPSKLPRNYKQQNTIMGPIPTCQPQPTINHYYTRCPWCRQLSITDSYVGSWERPSELHQSYIPLGVRNFVDFGPVYEGNHEKIG